MGGIFRKLDDAIIARVFQPAMDFATGIGFGKRSVLLMCLTTMFSFDAARLWLRLSAGVADGTAWASFGMELLLAVILIEVIARIERDDGSPSPSTALLTKSDFMLRLFMLPWSITFLPGSADLVWVTKVASYLSFYAYMYFRACRPRPPTLRRMPKGVPDAA